MHHDGNTLFRKWFERNASSLRGNFNNLPEIRDKSLAYERHLKTIYERTDLLEAKNYQMIKRYVLKLTTRFVVLPKSQLKSLRTRAVCALALGDMSWRRGIESTDENRKGISQE